MSVDDVDFLYCEHCKRHTAQSTYWDASRPDRLECRCMECQDHHSDRFINLINWLIEAYSPTLLGAKEWIEAHFPETDRWGFPVRPSAG